MPPIAGREKAELRYVLFLSQRPKAKPKLASKLTLIDARDVLAALS